jgi:hypothetical protein
MSPLSMALCLSLSIHSPAFRTLFSHSCSSNLVSLHKHLITEEDGICRDFDDFPIEWTEGEILVELASCYRHRLAICSMCSYSRLNVHLCGKIHVAGKLVTWIPRRGYCWSAEFDIAASDWTPIDFISCLILSYARRIYEGDRNQHTSILAFSSSQQF